MSEKGRGFAPLGSSKPASSLLKAQQCQQLSCVTLALLPALESAGKVPRHHLSSQDMTAVSRD